MSTYQINYNNFTNNDSIIVLKGIANFDIIGDAEEYIKELSWKDNNNYSILDIKGLFVVYPSNDAEKINKLFKYDIINRPESVKLYDKAKKALEIARKMHSNKCFDISNDLKFINVNYKNGKLFKQYRVDQLA